MKVAIKIALVFVLLIGMNWWYEKTLFVPYLMQQAPEYLQLKKLQNCDAIYMSASSNFSPSPYTEDKRKISQFVSAHFPELQLEAITKPAAHLGVYRDLVSLIDQDAEVQTIIIALNLRSFSYSWVHSDLETALNQDRVMYNNRPPLLNRALVALNGYDDQSPADRNATLQEIWRTAQLPFDPPKNTVTSWCAVEKWGDWQNPTRNLADHFIKQYGFVVDENHPRIKDLDAIVSKCQQRGWNLLLNILPENIETADSLVGSDLTGLMRSNKDWVISRYADQAHVHFADNFELLGAEAFSDKDFPTEHYYESGRKKVAEAVAVVLSEIVPSPMVAPVWKHQIQREQ